MGPLKNTRHECFAQAMAQGKTATDAYVIAGFKPDDGNASKLAAKPDVQARIQEITGKAALRAEVTLESLIQEADAARLGAMAAGQFSAAVAAIKEKGVLSGKRIERAEVGGPGDFERMSDDELDIFITSRTGRTGLGIAGTGVALDSGAARSSGRPH